MTPQEAAWQAATEASEVLAPETGLFAGVDTADFSRSVLSVLARATTRPDQVTEAWLQFGNAMLRAWPVAAARWFGSDLEPPVPLDAKDRRFADPTWEGNPAFFALRQAYLAARRLGEDLLTAGRGRRHGRPQGRSWSWASCSTRCPRPTSCSRTRPR